LYAQDGKTLVGSATTNSEGWADLGQQPEQFAIAYKAGNQFIYQSISNSGEIKVVTPFNETVEPNEGCPVSKAVTINGIPQEEPDDFSPEYIEVRTNHPEWIATLGEDRKTITICAARAPLDGKFDLWISSKAGYQQVQDVSWQGNAAFNYAPQAPALSSWRLSTSAPLFAANVMITNDDQLAVYNELIYDVAGSFNTQLAVPKLNTGSYHLILLGQADSPVAGFKVSRSFTSLASLPALDVPAAGIEQLGWDASQQKVTWKTNPSASIDFFELEVDLGNAQNPSSLVFTTLLDKDQSSFTLPQLPAEIPAPDANRSVDLSSVDYQGYNNLGDWLGETQSPLITLQEYIEKRKEAENNATRVILYKN
jgi:hypothetical protein